MSKNMRKHCIEYTTLTQVDRKSWKVELAKKFSDPAQESGSL